MKPVLRSLIISTVVVVAYPTVVLVVVWPLAILLGGPYASTVLDALWRPLDLPGFIMQSLHPSEHVSLGRVPIEQTLLVLGWFIAFNAILYYVPIRLVLEWREGSPRLR